MLRLSEGKRKLVFNLLSESNIANRKSLSRDCRQTCLYALRPLSLIYLQRYKKYLNYANILIIILLKINDLSVKYCYGVCLHFQC